MCRHFLLPWRRILVILTLLSGFYAQAEHVIVSGGPALMAQEGYRLSGEQHDRWWANFIRSATLRMSFINREGKQGGITWMVYKKGYEQRGREDGKPYITYIQYLAKKYGAKLVWLDNTNQFFSTINKFAKGGNKIVSFDYFGHSNRSAFMIDYSCGILGVSECWIHETDLGKINGNAFSDEAICYSYGCFTGESMSHYWVAKTGIPLISSTGKTDYSVIMKGKLPVPSSGGAWTQ